MNGWQSLWPWQKDQRFDPSPQDQDVFDMYSMPSQLLNSLKRRPQEAFLQMPINLGTAGVKEIECPGAAIVIYGFENGSANEAVDTTVFMQLFLEQQGFAQPFSLKHNRGFCGPFSKAIVKWPAQQNSGQDRWCNLVIYRGLFRPWIDGSAAT